MPDLGLLVLRAGPSGLMMTHGWPKMNRLLDQWGSEEGVKFFDFMGLGPEVSLILTVLAELVAPALMVVGWKTRWAALPAAFTMGVAAFVVHGGDPFGDKELALLHLVCFAAVAALGGGGLEFGRGNGQALIQGPSKQPLPIDRVRTKEGQCDLCLGRCRILHLRVDSDHA